MFLPSHLHTGSDQKVPAPAPQHCLQIPISSKSYTQDNTDNTEFDLTLAIFYRICETTFHNFFQ